MDWSYLTNPEKGLKSLIRLTLVPLILLVLLQLIVVILTQLSALELLGLLVFFALVSPAAYLIREGRLGRSPEAPRRGAERTPLLPLDEEEEE